MTIRLTRIAGAAAILLVAGCAIGPDYQRPVAPLLPAYAASVETPAASVNAQWWTLFNDPVLDQIVAIAQQNNADLRLALARVEQANAAAREAGAALLPAIDAGASAVENHISDKAPSYAGKTRISDRSAALSASFELDVWGRLRRNSEAARAALLASAYGRDAVQLSVTALVVNQYLLVRSLDAQLAVATDSLICRDTAVGLVQARVGAGLASGADADVALAAREAADAQLADLRRQRALAFHQLALLAGKPDLTLAAGDLHALPTPPLPPAGLPADLIDARPDVRQAEQQLVAANAAVGVAKAGYFPKFTLTGALGTESETLSGLFTAGSGTSSAGLGVLIPILDFGRVSARVDQAQAQKQQALVGWQNTLQTAYKEVRDALVTTREARVVAAAQHSRAAASTDAWRLAQARYQAGLNSYLDLLTQQLTRNDAQLVEIGARQAQLTAAVALFKALGGGWQPKP